MKRSARLIAAALIATGTMPLSAGNTWDGGGTDDNWSTGDNWDPNGVPGYGTLTFSGATRTTNIVNANTSMNMLLWTGSSAWTLNNSGGAIISLYDNGGVQAKIENQSSGLVTINAPVDFAATVGTNRGEINAVNGDITFGSGGTITASGSAVQELHFYGSGRTVTINSVITAGSRSLVIGPSTSDNNTVILNGANSYSGGTAINAGSVQVGNNSGLGTGIAYVGNGGPTFANLNASLLLNASGLTVSNAVVTNKADTGGGFGTGTRTLGGTFTSGSSTFSGNISLDGGAILTAGSGGTVIFSGVIANGLGSGSVSRALTINAAGGTIDLSNTNTYTGGTTLTAGTLSFANGSLGTTGGITMNGGELRWSSGNTQDISSRIVMVNSTAANFNTNGNNVALGSIFGGGTSGSLAKIGAGTLTLGGRNTYTGSTTVNAGTLQLNDARSLGGAAIVNSGATLTLQNNGNGGFYQPASLTVNNGTVNGVQSSYNRYHGIYTTSITTSGTASVGTPIYISKTGVTTNETLTIDVATGSTTTFGGTILNHPDLSGGLVVKNGAGTLTLNNGAIYSGNSTTLTGNMVINAGMVVVNFTANNASPTGTALGNMTTAGRTITVNSGATLRFDAPDAIGQYNYGSPVKIIADGGTITRVSSANSFNSLGAIELKSGGKIITTNGNALTVGSFAFNGTVTVSGTSGSSIERLAGQNTNNYINLGTVGGSTTFDVASTGDPTADLTVSAVLGDRVLGGAGGLIKSGAGKMVLSGANTFSGNMSINGGTVVASLTVNNASPSATSLGNMTTGGRTITVNSGATLLFNQPDAIGQYDYKTPVTLIADGGTITRVAGSFNSLGNITLRNGGRLTSNNGQNSTVNSFSLNGDVTVDGTSGSFIDTSGTTDNSIHLATGVGSSNINFTVASTGDSVADLTVSAPLRDKTLGGAAGITKLGAGTMVLSGTNSYTGATNINVGTLLINGNNSAATGAVTVASVATLGGTGTVGGAVTVSGGVAPGSNGIGTLTTNGGVTWNGGNNWKFELSSVSNTSDKLAMGGVFAKGSGSSFNFDFLGSTPVWNTTYTLATFASFSGFNGMTPEFSYSNLGTGSYSTSYFTLNGTSLTFTAIPEVSNVLAGILLGFGLLGRRRGAAKGSV